MGIFGVEFKVKIKIIQYVHICYITAALIANYVIAARISSEYAILLLLKFCLLLNFSLFLSLSALEFSSA